MRKTAWIVVLLAATALPSAAQPGPSTGSRVRADAPTVSDARIVGRVAAATADSLLLSVSGGAAVLRLSKESIQTLQVSRGRDRLKWGVLGAGAGFLGGAVIGAALGGHDDPSGWGALAGMIGGAALGLPAGAVGGALLAPERWVRYDLPRGDR
jgi:hypothetical protein